jgi:iron-sulfur cluster repair protein YtfE (RIC family)
MPVQIGGSVHDFSDPTGFLSDCHRRIEMFLGALETVAKGIDAPLTAENRRGLEAALRYFRESAPKHNADEEESLFPRMRRIRDSEVQSAVAKIGKLEKEHRWAAPLHAEVERLGTIYLSGKSLSPEEVEGFRRAVSELAAMYREHIRVEEDVVFPAARMLSRDEQAAVGEEMAARRNARNSAS